MNTLKIFILLVCVGIIHTSCDSDSSDIANTTNEFGQDGQSGSLARFVTLENYLYTVDYQNLNVFNISNTENPVLVNTINVGFNIETLSSYKDYLYIGSRNGMFIYNASQLETPQLLSSVQHFTACDPVIANDSHAFVTLKGGNLCGEDLNILEVYDVTDAENPILLSQRNMIEPIGLGFYQNDYLFVCDDQVKIFDISDPENMQLVHAIDADSFDVIIQNNLLILIGETGLTQYMLNPDDIQNETFLSSLSL
ncbi:LVIVD repeat-containing protein [Kordia sp.]|uniref:LVIVD repeat-containing protein n=1 Tax=Kordia sp. TaxID=1965332 RepID=UPI003D29936A